MCTATNAATIDEQSKGHTANLTLIGTLLARMVLDEVAAGRWYVDDVGCAHPVDGERPGVVEYLRDKPVLVLQEENCHAAPQR